MWNLPRWFAAIGCVVACGTAPVRAADEAAPPAGAVLRVMTFNIWVGGEAGKQPLSQTVAVIRAAEADIVGLQETRGPEVDGRRPDNSVKIAEFLGWHHFDQGGGRAVISRYPITGSTPRKWGVRIELPDGQAAWIFNAHLSAAPYQPYQLLKIPYAGAPFVSTADEAIAAARAARGDQVARLLGDLRPVLATGSPVFLTGDFNEPSCRDWTAAAVAAGRCPIEVRWPTTAAIEEAGLIDAFRTIHPDEVAHPGWTWTPTTAADDPKDKHDRIDLVFAHGERLRILDAQVVGEAPEQAGIVVTPYPSDHRAVVVTVTLGR